MRTWTMLAAKTDRGLRHFFRSEQAVRMCGADPVVTVDLREDPDGEFRGWLTDSLGCIQPKGALFDIQFCYGWEAEVKAGRGEVVPLSAVEVKPCEP